MAPRDRYRFGIGEWYGKPFVSLSPEERQHYAEIQLLPKGQRPEVPCPFLSTSSEVKPCKKAGGVCSLRQYGLAEDGQVVPRDSGLRTTCPNRLQEENKIYAWIGEALLGDRMATPIGQVNFKGLGRIDAVLLASASRPLSWCAIEIQSVYFSGKRMREEFEVIRRSDGIPFPLENRRPDYLSSGLKRLMPQLQVKAPALNRWGKKVAVVVDEHFFEAMGMEGVREVNDVTNCEVAWFIVSYDGAHALERGRVCLTTLREAVSQLTEIQPVSQQEFERRILEKYSRLGSGPPEIATDD